MMLILKKKDSILSLYCASFALENIEEVDQLKVRPDALDLPTRYDSYKFEPLVLGSCNGLLCVSFPLLEPLQYPPCCILWNPSTRTHHVIQNEPATESLSKIDGLGYDEDDDGYKLVRFVEFVGQRNDTQIWVHSFTNGSWTMVSRANWIIPKGGFTDVFVNGCLHFKMQTSIQVFLIVAFDVSKETYKLITTPDCIDTISTFELGVLDGCLSMVVRRNETYIVLEMKEYGCGRSWVELFRFYVYQGPTWMRPLIYVANQNKKTLLLEGEGDLFCIDVESHQQVPITGTHCKGFTDVCVCTEESECILNTADTTTLINVSDLVKKT